MRMKPNISAFSTAIVAGKDKLKKAQGTSFSSPLTAGFAACAWQTMRKKNSSTTNMEVFTALQKSANLYPYFDYAHGYGIPQASYFLTGKKEVEPTFSFERTGDTVNIKAKSNYIKTAGKDRRNYLFVHVVDSKNKILKYWMVEVFQEDAFSIDLVNFPRGEKIQAHFQSYTNSFEIK